MMIRANILADKGRNTHKKVSCLLMLAAWLCGMPFFSCDPGFSSSTITAEEFRFTPTLVKLPAGQNVRLIVRNQGRERHVFQSPILARKDVFFDRISPARPWKRADGIQIQPGEQIEFILKLPEGLYPFRCQIQGHKGMEGTLVVEK